MGSWIQLQQAWRFTVDPAARQWPQPSLAPLRIARLANWPHSLNGIEVPRPDATWVLLVVDGDAAVAHHAMQRQDPKRALLFGGNTHPAFQRRGLMKALTFELFRLAASEGIEVVEASVGLGNQASQALCSRCGMQKSGLERRLLVGGRDVFRILKRGKSSRGNRGLHC